MMVGLAMMTNVRRISRYLNLKREHEMLQKQGKEEQICPKNSALFSYLVKIKSKISSLTEKYLQSAVSE
jgi:hypothetical protein